jgi:hypothetical protein
MIHLLCLARGRTRLYASPLPRATPAGWRSDRDENAYVANAHANSAQALNGGTDDYDGSFGLPKHARSFHAQHVIPEPAKLLIPPRFRAALVQVRAPVHFHDQAQSGREKVSDVPPAHRHLPAEHHPQTATGKLPPEACFR